MDRNVVSAKPPKVHLQNACNTISRALRGAKVLGPDLVPWAAWSSVGDSPLYCAREKLKCAAGVQQGDPFSPLSDSLRQTLIRSRCGPRRWPLFWDPDAVAKALAKITQLFKQVDLEINNSKCETLSVSCNPGRRCDKSPGCLMFVVGLILDHNNWSEATKTLRRRWHVAQKFRLSQRLSLSIPSAYCAWQQERAALNSCSRPCGPSMFTLCNDG